MKLSTVLTPVCAGLIAVSLQACASDYSVARVQSQQAVSPAGIWLTDLQLSNGSAINQLVVIETLGGSDYRVHECALTGNASEALSRAHYHGGQLRSGWAVTDSNFTQPYSESELMSLVVEGDSLAGEYHLYDRNLDGSYSSHDIVGITGTKVSNAQSLDTLSAQEIQTMLGVSAEWSATTPRLGTTCAAVRAEQDIAAQLAAEMMEDTKVSSVVASAAR